MRLQREESSVHHVGRSFCLPRSNRLVPGCGQPFGIAAGGEQPARTVQPQPERLIHLPFMFPYLHNCVHSIYIVETFIISFYILAA